MLPRNSTARARTTSLALAAVLAVLAPGAPRREPEQDSRPAPRAVQALGEQRDDHFAVQLLIVTDRRWDEQEEAFGNARGPGLQYVVSEVGIPERHQTGRVEEPKAFAREKPHKHVMLLNHSRAAEREFVGRLRRQVARSPRKEILVFVPGAATSLPAGARRAAQIAYDIRFDGVVVLYSWPTEGRVLRYTVDETNAMWTQPHLSELLGLLSRESGAERIHLLAHSLGNRILTRAVKELVRARPADDQAPFDQIVLAAADMDVDIFKRDIAPYLERGARRITMYVSNRDWALGASRALHKYPRLGQGDKKDGDLHDASRIDLIDASAVTKWTVGHAYYGNAPQLLADLRAVLRGDPPERRRLTETDQCFRLKRR